MPAREQADQELMRHLLLPHDHLGELALDPAPALVDLLHDLALAFVDIQFFRHPVVLGPGRSEVHFVGWVKPTDHQDRQGLALVGFTHPTTASLDCAEDLSESWHTSR